MLLVGNGFNSDPDYDDNYKHLDDDDSQDEDDKSQNNDDLQDGNDNQGDDNPQDDDGEPENPICERCGDEYEPHNAGESLDGDIICDFCSESEMKYD